MSQSDTPLEAFKRATEATIRAIARRDDLNATFTSAPQGLVGKDVKLPLIHRDLPAAEASLVRGEADSVALRLRHHDDSLHQKQRPRSQEARDIFDAVEQARCESLGMKRMTGCTLNLDAAREERYKARGYGRAANSEDVPLAEVLGLLARESMTGHSPTPCAKHMIDVWRPLLDSKATKSDVHPGHLSTHTMSKYLLESALYIEGGSLYEHIYNADALADALAGEVA